MKKHKISSGIWIRTKKVITYLCQFIINITSTLNKFSALIVAIATIALVCVTYLYIDESKKMAIQTKRLADISIEQFKIKSYPSLEVVAGIQSIDSEGISEKYDVINTAGTTALHCTFLPIHISLDKKGTHHFIPLVATFYSGQERLTVLNHSINIPPSMLKYLETRRNFSEFTLQELKYLLLFIRFRVPYDEKFSYETFGWYLKKTPTQTGSVYNWLYLADTDIDLRKKQCVENLRGQAPQILGNESERVLEFFRDFSY